MSVLEGYAEFDAGFSLARTRLPGSDESAPRPTPHVWGSAYSPVKWQVLEVQTGVLETFIRTKLEQQRVVEAELLRRMVKLERGRTENLRRASAVEAVIDAENRTTQRGQIGINS